MAQHKLIWRNLRIDAATYPYVAPSIFRMRHLWPGCGTFTPGNRSIRIPSVGPPHGTGSSALLRQMAIRAMGPINSSPTRRAGKPAPSRRNARSGSPKMGPCPPFGTTQRYERGIAVYISTARWTGYSGSRSPCTIRVRAAIVARCGGVRECPGSFLVRPKPPKTDWRDQLQSLTGIDAPRCEVCGQKALCLVGEVAPARAPRAPPLIPLSIARCPYLSAQPWRPAEPGGLPGRLVL